ncbi:glycerophosphodiester phosphodiesterase [Romboutsia ilealis]|uniref:Glycerophosphodiester phosphodiesterase n=1 Tax=Romboutsia faecis TaxID=2764597 RepID=A0ABR7JLV2_9FIRM|nr:glycerophosphodiester phosphodiesterase family protein [Romboutsia faecis]MBC5995898.1 glycerophosphodiester phosphodiesterase [Romboutsia faecis]MRN23098.1 glycerophosphodiester phosphodiesterase [Romboutsia ilealis]
MKIFAHRGDSWFYPKNTILAFEKALSLPIYGIELDIHKSKDNQLVVIHDETINRTFKGKGFVKDYTLKELQSFKCKKLLFKNNKYCKIPSLEEVFNLIKDKNIILNIEVKPDSISYKLEEDLINLIKKYKLENKILISSFNYKCLRKFQNIEPNLKYGALYSHKSDYTPEINIVEHAKKLNVSSIHISKRLLRKNIIDLAHDNNLEIFVYTVNTPLSVLKMIKYNVDGVFTDCQSLIYNILNKNN